MEERLYGPSVTIDTSQPAAEASPDDAYKQEMFALADELEKAGADERAVNTARFLGAYGTTDPNRILAYFQHLVENPPMLDEEGETDDAGDEEEPEYDGPDAACDSGGSADEGDHGVHVEDAGGCGDVPHDQTDGPAGPQAPQ